MNLRNFNFEDHKYHTIILETNEKWSELEVQYTFIDISNVRYMFFRLPQNPIIVYQENYFIVMVDFGSDLKKYFENFFQDIREFLLKNLTELENEDFRHFKEIFYI